MRTVRRPRRRPGGIDSVLVGVDAFTADASSPGDVLAGFDAVVQFSRNLLQTQIARSLLEKGLNTLSARTAWDPTLAPPQLRAVVAARFHHIETRPGIELEVRLLTPTLTGMTWPPPSPGGPEGPVDPTPVSWPDVGREAQARGLPRRVQVTWQVEINLLIPSLQTSVDPQSGGSGGTGYYLERTLLGTGTAQVTATPNLASSRRWLFGMELAFGDDAPTTNSDDLMVTELVSVDFGKALLGRAVAPLTLASDIKLTPTVGPAGPLSQPQMQRLDLPPLRVRDALLTDSRGVPVLSLCVDIGSPPSGVPRLLSPFLEHSDFAYAVSINLLGPALKARWDGTSAGLSFVGDVPVELPISEDSEETATGRARVYVSIAGVLGDAAFRPSIDYRGDPLRLLSEQTIRLLELWDYRERQITDLGPLGEARTEPFVLPLYLFDEPPAGLSQDLHPDFERFILKLLTVMVYPLVDRFRIKDVSGFTSSAMQLMLSRWTLRTPVDDVRPPVGGVVIRGNV
jgi:hypothetical protein